jgi:hypothetical protein
MANRDLTAQSSQAKSELSAEAVGLGEKLYAQIVDDGDKSALQKLEQLAEASERMETPVEVDEPEQPGHLTRLLAGIGAIVAR